MYSKHSELGDFLRSRRQKVDVKQMRLGGTKHRRTAGLRREEVAELAGIGVDWYTRLEQGRAVSPSPRTVEALSRALRLDSAERAHFEALTHHGGRRKFCPEVVPEPVRRLLDGLRHPAYVTGRRWDVLAWNRAACEMLTDFNRVVEEDRNILIWMLIAEEARRIFGAGWHGEAKRMIAVFRTTHDLWAGDPAFVALLKRLREGSPQFVELWDTHDVRSTTAGRKVLYHPTKGARQFEYTSFQSNDDPSLKLSIYTLLERI